MPGTFSQILLHIVFSTKHRERLITPELSARLYPFIGGIIRSEGGSLYAIGGIEDHLHLYLRWRTDDAISKLVRDLKSRSTKWVHELEVRYKNFSWQEGYSVFSVSRSQEEVVKQYIARQEEHHQKVDFQSELLSLLKKHDVEFDERYVFD